MKVANTTKVPEGYVAADSYCMSGIIALPEELFEITDPHERFRAIADYLSTEFTNEGIIDLLNDDLFVGIAKEGLVGSKKEITVANMDIEEELEG